MKSFNISLTDPGQISTLVNITNQYPFTIILRQGQYHVDGKSLLGICSLEHSKPIQLEAYCDHCDELVGALGPMID